MDKRNINILEHNIEYWYEDDQEMSEHEQEYVRSSIMKGYIEGELVTNDNTGWWKINND